VVLVTTRAEVLGLWSNVHPSVASSKMAYCHTHLFAITTPWKLTMCVTQTYRDGDKQRADRSLWTNAARMDALSLDDKAAWFSDP
jgi:hypothetical protein